MKVEKKTCLTCRRRKVFCRGFPGAACDTCVSRGEEDSCVYADRSTKEELKDDITEGENARARVPAHRKRPKKPAKRENGNDLHSMPSPPSTASSPPIELYDTQRLTPSPSPFELQVSSPVLFACMRAYKSLPQFPQPALQVFGHPLLALTQLWVGSLFQLDDKYVSLTGMVPSDATRTELAEASAQLGRTALALLHQELKRINLELSAVDSPYSLSYGNELDPLSLSNLSLFITLAIIPRAYVKQGKPEAIFPFARAALYILRRFADHWNSSLEEPDMFRWLMRRQWLRNAWGFLILDMGRVALLRRGRFVVNVLDYGSLQVPPGDHVNPGARFPALNASRLFNSLALGPSSPVSSLSPSLASPSSGAGSPASTGSLFNGNPNPQPVDLSFMNDFAELGPVPLRLAVIYTAARISELAALMAEHGLAIVDLLSLDYQTEPSKVKAFYHAKRQHQALITALEAMYESLPDGVRMADSVADLDLLTQFCFAYWPSSHEVGLHTAYVLAESLVGIHMGLLRLYAPEQYLGDYEMETPERTRSASNWISTPHFVKASTHAIQLSKYSNSFLVLAKAVASGASSQARPSFGLSTYLLASPLMPGAILNAAFFHAACLQIAKTWQGGQAFADDARACTMALGVCSWKGMGDEVRVLNRMIDHGVSVLDSERLAMERSVGGRDVETEDQVVGIVVGHEGED